MRVGAKFCRVVVISPVFVVIQTYVCSYIMLPNGNRISHMLSSFSRCWLSRDWWVNNTEQERALRSNKPLNKSLYLNNAILWGCLRWG